ncbi:hypothetical protein WISP_72506 [Willisornis vidua]|uniref:Uncharacterized protein n=1 Tax=Willisornis vidua TaxID=1566151 RepID=A0ABQ9DDA1_9PASS|nr:hypothetical protein WISP_72506 [Willisornis vidua]
MSGMASDHNTSSQDEYVPHYLQKEDPFASKLSREADIIAGFYLTVIGILSTLGNGYVIFMSSKRKKKLRPAEIMTVNLAVCDLGISGVSHSAGHGYMLIEGSTGCPSEKDILDDRQSNGYKDPADHGIGISPVQ